MADNYTTPGPYTFRAVDVGGVLHAVGLVGWGATPTLVSASSGAGLPVQPDAGAVFHVVVDSGSITVGSHAVTNAGTFAVQVSSALPAGTNVIGHVIVDSGTITTVSTVTAVTAITNALPAGSNVIGHVIVDSGTITTVSAVTAITNALPAGTNVIGSVTPASATTGGASMYHLPSSANTTNATNVKNAAGTVYGLEAFNTSAATKYLKLYDKASAPSVGSDTPVKTIAIPPTSGGALGGVVRSYPVGLAFPTGISYALTGAAADNDTTALASGDVVGLGLDYK